MVYALHRNKVCLRAGIGRCVTLWTIPKNKTLFDLFQFQISLLNVLYYAGINFSSKKHPVSFFYP
jgi:hypothetical protein